MGMRVLFTAKHPPGGALRYGGVLSWIDTMAAEFRRLGHDCEVWGPELKQPEGRFDLGVIANATSTDRAAQWCGRVIGVSHGVVPDEVPNPSIRTVFTSEEVRDHWGNGGPILRQPIDLDFWKPGDAPREKSLVFYSYRAPDDMGLDRTAAELGLDFVRLRNVTREAARDSMQRAAVVAASGRAAVEAMACGAAVMICDHRAPYQGALLDPDAFGAIERNYSGRGGIARPDNPVRAVAINSRSRVLENRTRPWAEKHHDVRKIAAELLAYA